MYRARIMGHHNRPDGSTDTYWSGTVECVERKTFQPGATRKRTPSRFIVLFNGRWRRVYLDMTKPSRHRAYIGRLSDIGEQIRIDCLPC